MGWFKTERDIIDKAIFNDKSLLQLYIYLRSQAKWKPTERIIDGQKAIIQPGQLTVGSRELASILGTSPTTAYRMLKKLEKLGEIEIKTFKSCSLITLIFWPEENEKDTKSETPPRPEKSTDKGQFRNTDETQMKREWNTDETQMKTPIEINKDRNLYKEYIYTIFQHWNSKKIIVHRELTDSLKGHINARLKHYSVNEILEAIDNYDTILKGDEYFWTYKWGLGDFLTRQNGFVNFLTENNPFNNYRKTKIQPKGNKPSSQDNKSKLEAIFNELEGN